jgi:hypothetical protein
MPRTLRISSSDGGSERCQSLVCPMGPADLERAFDALGVLISTEMVDNTVDISRGRLRLNLNGVACKHFA